MHRRDFLAFSLAGLVSGGCRSPGSRAAWTRPLIGANTAVSGYGLDQAIRLLAMLGFPAIEIHPMGVPEARPGRFPGFEFGTLSEGEKRRIREALAGFRHVTTHLPYSGLSFFAADEEKARRSRRVFETAMEATAHFGAEVGVMHVTAPEGATLEEAWPRIVRQLRRWGDLAREGGFRLAVETGYPRSAEEFVRLIKETGHDAVGACIDVGHQIGYREFASRFSGKSRSTPAGLLAYNDLIHDMIDRLGRKLIHLHVHDIDPETFKEHKPLGLGVIDYPRLFGKLEATGYQDLLVLEIGAKDMPAALADSKRRLERALSRE